jgi:dGTPase
LTPLAVFASDPAATRGRRFLEPPAPTRTAFQRDRDRVVHSSGFRRLVYKTQVFLNHEGDLFRTRLTHSLEVAQLGRSIARALGLNEDLVEAISLAHDLGHTPFGHAGQDALNICMKNFGGFEHNLQSLRVVDRLEQRYPAFDGLNLCFETREGILKHCSRANALALEAEEAQAGVDQALGGVGRRFLARSQPSLEAQLCNLADEIAYNAHDIDDGVRSGLITLSQLETVPVFERHRASTLAEFPHLAGASQGRRLLYESIRRMLSAQVYDVIGATQAALAQHAPLSADEARHLPPLLQFGAATLEGVAVLKRFLMESLYRHPQVMQTTALARRVVADLFDAFMAQPREMQPGFHEQTMAGDGENQAGAGTARVVADYIAGMTDRMATREHERLTGQRLLT